MNWISRTCQSGSHDKCSRPADCGCGCHKPAPTQPRLPLDQQRSEHARLRLYWQRELEAYWRQYDRAAYGHAAAVAEAIS